MVIDDQHAPRSREAGWLRISVVATLIIGCSYIGLDRGWSSDEATGMGIDTHLRRRSAFAVLGLGPAERHENDLFTIRAPRRTAVPNTPGPPV